MSRHADVVSWMCRPVAAAQHMNLTGPQCGTSFAAPTVAGALSRVILDLRLASGHTGSGGNGMVDPMLEITNIDIRDALNLTATYAPASRYSESALGVPANVIASWHQWGWGFYDSTVVDETVAHMLLTKTATKPAETVQWMQAQHEIKKQLWGT